MNNMRREAQRSASTKSLPRRATVSAYDPTHYAAKVIIQPEGFETGFLPIGSPWIGQYCPPSIGDEVDVHFQEGGKNAAYIALRFYGNVEPPASVASHEYWLLHASGSKFKLTNDGKVLVQDASGASLTLNNDGTAVLKANLIVDGSITSTGDITDLSATTGSSIAHFRAIYDSHTHGGVQTGGGNTAIPNQEI